MAINKVINNPAKTHAAMRSLIRYVLKDEKVQDGYVMVQGPFNYDVINAETSDAAARDDVSKRIARERRSEERMRYSHRKTSERGLG